MKREGHGRENIKRLPYMRPFVRRYVRPFVMFLHKP